MLFYGKNQFFLWQALFCVKLSCIIVKIHSDKFAHHFSSLFWTGIAIMGAEDGIQDASNYILGRQRKYWHKNTPFHVAVSKQFSQFQTTSIPSTPTLLKTHSAGHAVSRTTFSSFLSIFHWLPTGSKVKSL